MSVFCLFTFLGTTRIQPFQFPQHIQIGYKTTVTCSTIHGGSSQGTYKWYKNGNILKHAKNVNIESNERFSTLLLDPVDDSSIGNYTCLVSSPEGNDSYTAFLEVKGKLCCLFTI